VALRHLARWLAAALAAVFASFAAGGQVTVSLRGKVEPARKLVSLGDVAEVAGDERELVERVAAVLLCAAPGRGEVNTIGQNHIKARLHQEGIPPSRVSFTGRRRSVAVLPFRGEDPSDREPERDESSRRPGSWRADEAIGAGRGPEIAPGEGLARAIRLHAAEELGLDECSVEVEILNLQWVGPSPAPQGGRGLEFGVARRDRGGRLGRARYVVVARRGREVAGRALVQAEIVRRCGPASPGGAREPESTLEREAAGSSHAAALGRDTDVVGAARGPAAAEEAIPEPALVEAGEIVTVVSGDAHCRTADRARARRAGARGQVIPVENLRSRKEFLARVIDEQLVAAVP
jgi:hypothetical protein